jgi:rhodanese-related sulfurtransferase
LTTVEINPQRHQTALANFKEAGLASYIDARLSDAHEVADWPIVLWRTTVASAKTAKYNPAHERTRFPRRRCWSGSAGAKPLLFSTYDPGEFGEGHVPGAVNVPFTGVLAGSDDLCVQKSQTVVVYCGHGPRAWLAGEALRWRGILARHPPPRTYVGLAAGRIA